jgi:transposase-like protein
MSEMRASGFRIAGTIFQDTRKPLKTWFTAMWWIATQKYGASAEGLKQVLGLKSCQTAWMWLHKIRRAMVRPGRERLSGVIEVDETYLGGSEREGKRGRGTGNKALVVIEVECEGKRLGRVRMRVIMDASGESLRVFIGENISKGSTIITDGWLAYSKLEAGGYHHEIYTQNEAIQAEETLHHVQLVVSLLKRWLLGRTKGWCNQNICRSIWKNIHLDSTVRIRPKEAYFFTGCLRTPC